MRALSRSLPVTPDSLCTNRLGGMSLIAWTEAGIPRGLNRFSVCAHSLAHRRDCLTDVSLDPDWATHVLAWLRLARLSGEPGSRFRSAPRPP